MIRAFSYSWFTFNTLFYFRALYQIKGVKARFKRRTLHVPNLIYIFRSTQTIKFDCWFRRSNFTCAEPHSWRKEISFLPLKKGKYTEKSKFTKPGNSSFDLEIHCYMRTIANSIYPSVLMIMLIKRPPWLGSKGVLKTFVTGCWTTNWNWTMIKLNSWSLAHRSN